jgi:vesicular inhibitory amino acid transporter
MSLEISVDTQSPVTNEFASGTSMADMRSKKLQKGLHFIVNALNLLCGLGILSLPYAFKLSGWILGFTMLLAFAASASWTAFALISCLNTLSSSPSSVIRERDTRKLFPDTASNDNDDAVDETSTLLPSPSSTLVENEENQMELNYQATLADVGEAVFGLPGRWILNFVFMLELSVASIATLLVFSDSLTVLYPSLSNHSSLVKLGFIAVLTPVTWLKSLSVLSYVSGLGVLSVVTLIFILLFDGFSVSEGLGSLPNGPDTQLWPESWSGVCFSIGLLFVGLDGMYNQILTFFINR